MMFRPHPMIHQFDDEAGEALTGAINPTIAMATTALILLLELAIRDGERLIRLRSSQPRNKN